MSRTARLCCAILSAITFVLVAMLAIAASTASRPAAAADGSTSPISPQVASVLPLGLQDAMQFTSRPPLTMVWQPARMPRGKYKLPAEWQAFRQRILDLGNPLPARWQAGLNELRGLPEEEQLRRLTTAVLSIPYVSDDKNYGIHDYWAKPTEMLEHGGDCEDYAILAYRSLIELGWPDDLIDLVYLKDRKHDFEHVVLIVEVNGERRLIDNNRPDMPRFNDVSYYDFWHAFNGSTLVIF